MGGLKKFEERNINLNINYEAMNDPTNDIIIDSGSNINITKHAYYLENFQAFDESERNNNVITLNKQKTNLDGVGTLSLKIGDTLIKLETYLVEKSSINLLVSQYSLELNEVYAKNEYGSHSLVNKYGQTIIGTTYKNGILILENNNWLNNVEIIDSGSHNNSKMTNFNLHEKLGHIPNQKIKKLIKEGIIINATEDEINEINKDEECFTCQNSKMKMRRHYRNRFKEYVKKN